MLREIFCLMLSCNCYTSDADTYKKIFQLYSASHLEQKEIRIGLAYQQNIPKKLLPKSIQENKWPQSNQNCNNESIHLRVSSEK